MKAFPTQTGEFFANLPMMKSGILENYLSVCDEID